MGGIVMTAAVSFADVGLETVGLEIPPRPRPDRSPAFAAAAATDRAVQEGPRRIGEIMPEVLARYGLGAAIEPSAAALRRDGEACCGRRPWAALR
jgi:hypothetical protein